MIIYTHQKSKKKNKTKKEIAEYQAWLDNLNKMSTNFSRKSTGKITHNSSNVPKLTVPPGRESPKIASLSTFGGSCTKPIEGKVYTGTAMKGIGTLHKSNAVPIFSNEDMVDQAKMRR
jgi:hypothetical protein